MDVARSPEGIHISYPLKFDAEAHPGVRKNRLILE